MCLKYFEEGGVAFPSKYFFIWRRVGSTIQQYNLYPAWTLRAPLVVCLEKCCTRNELVAQGTKSLPRGSLNDLAKLLELKSKGVVLDRHYEATKNHVKAGNCVAKEQ